MSDWRSLIPPEERATYARAGYGADAVPGSGPALLVVDATKAFVGPRAATLQDATARYPGACGPVAWEAIGRIELIVGAFRALRLPVVYTVGAPLAWVQWIGRDKHDSRTQVPPADGRDIVDPIRPVDGDIVLEKPGPSAFHGTPLASLLVARGVDTVAVTGGTTSGCVRATVVDAFSHGFATVVIEDAVFDRSPLSHAVNLFEMGQKYADLLTTEAILRHLHDEG